MLEKLYFLKLFLFFLILGFYSCSREVDYKLEQSDKGKVIKLKPTSNLTFDVSQLDSFNAGVLLEENGYLYDFNHKPESSFLVLSKATLKKENTNEFSSFKKGKTYGVVLGSLSGKEHLKGSFVFKVEIVE